MAANPNVESNETFLQLIFAPFFEKRNGFIEIRSIRDGSSPMQEFYSNIEKIPINLILGKETNIYFGVAPRNKKSGQEKDIEYVTCLWADLDTPESQEKLTNFPITPSITANSGHGLHAYWLLKEIEKANRYIKQILRGLQESICSDHVHDLSRVMRLPGTWNFKTVHAPVQSKIITINDIRYSIDDFNIYKAEEKQTAYNSESDPFKSVPVNLENFRLSERCTRIIRSGNDGSFNSRSEADYFVINSLIEANATDNEIYSIFIDTRYRIGENSGKKESTVLST